MIFDPLDFIARLAALVPRPRVNRTRYPIPRCAGTEPQLAGRGDVLGQGPQSGQRQLTKPVTPSSCGVTWLRLVKTAGCACVAHTDSA